MKPKKPQKPKKRRGSGATEPAPPTLRAGANTPAQRKPAKRKPAKRRRLVPRKAKRIKASTVAKGPRIARKLDAKLARRATSEAAKPAPALRSWLAGSPAIVRKVKAAIERAKTSGEKRSTFAHGKRAFEIRRTAEGWDVIDARSKAPSPYVKRGRSAPRPAKAYSQQTDRERETARLKEARKKRTEEVTAQRQRCAVDRTSAASGVSGTARRLAVARSRERCAAGLLAIEERFDAEIGPIERERKRQGTRRTAAPVQGLSTVQRQERDDAMEGELLRIDRADLIPLWRRVRSSPAFRDLPFDRAHERFAELAQEDSQQVEDARDRVVAAATDPGTLACSEAQHLARQGDPAARDWAAENCNGAKPKGSAKSRTRSLFDGIAPPSSGAVKKTAEPVSKKKSRRDRSQQTLSTARGTSVLDAVPF